MTILAQDLMFFFRFAEPRDAIYDTQVGRLLEFSMGPLWVYDLRKGGGEQEPGAWVCLVLPASYFDELKTNPNVVFIFSAEDGVLYRNVTIEYLDYLDIENVASGVFQGFYSINPIGAEASA